MAYAPGTVDIDRLLDGHSLRAVLYPDETVADYPESVVEGFQLPNVVIVDGTVWGRNHCLHPADEVTLVGDVDWDLSLPGSYAYNNFADLVVNSSPFSGMVRIYKASKYKQVRFVTVPDFRLLWDSDEDGDAAVFEPEIEGGRRLRVALLDDDGVWNIHPVDLAVYLRDSNLFRLDTPKDGYPEFMRDPDRARNIAEQMAALGGTTYSMGGEFHLNRYRIRRAGSYLHQVGAELVEKSYRRLKVFCEN